MTTARSPFCAACDREETLISASLPLRLPRSLSLRVARLMLTREILLAMHGDEVPLHHAVYAVQVADQRSTGCLRAARTASRARCASRCSWCGTWGSCTRYLDRHARRWVSIGRWWRWRRFWHEFRCKSKLHRLVTGVVGGGFHARLILREQISFSCISSRTITHVSFFSSGGVYLKKEKYKGRTCPSSLLQRKI